MSVEPPEIMLENPLVGAERELAAQALIGEADRGELVETLPSPRG